MTSKRRGAPPSTLTGGQRVRPLDSPWWDQIASRIGSDPGLVGRILSIEEIAQIIGDYPGGRQVRPRTASRRLSKVLELVSRGPNGSRGRGATYRILSSLPVEELGGRDDVSEVEIRSDMAWLMSQVERMTGGKT